MNQSRGLASAQPAHLEALRARHAALQDRIEAEQRRPSVGNEVIRDLKRRKLRLKEMIVAQEQAQSQTRH